MQSGNQFVKGEQDRGIGVSLLHPLEHLTVRNHINWAFKAVEELGSERRALASGEFGGLGGNFFKVPWIKDSSVVRALLVRF
jgi:hypothetical protein